MKAFLLVPAVILLLANIFANFVLISPVLASARSGLLDTLVVVLILPILPMVTLVVSHPGAAFLLIGLVGGVMLFFAEGEWSLLPYEEAPTLVLICSYLAVSYSSMLVAKAQSDPSWWLIVAMMLVVPTAINIFLWDYDTRALFFSLRRKFNPRAARL